MRFVILLYGDDTGDSLGLFLYIPHRCGRKNDAIALPFVSATVGDFFCLQQGKNMSKIVQLRRGNASEHNTFTGKIGEVTMDTDNKTLRVHDGETVGGTALAKQSEIPDLTPYDYVIEWQTPTADNNYTWYRKYKSGWVEQGGLMSNRALTSQVTLSATMPIETIGNTIMASPVYISGESVVVVTTFISGKTINVTLEKNNTASSQNTTASARWFVCGQCVE